MGYTSGDTISIGDCIYEPQLTPRGSIIAVTSPASCVSRFTNLPTVVINSTTGIGAELFPVIQFIPQFIVDNDSALSGLSTGDILKVIQCISTNTVIGSSNNQLQL